MLSSILGDIASRMLTKSGEEDRVANFASRVADEMEQENSANFKPTPDYMKNKKIAIQLAKRYIDDYKKMEKDPEYEKQVRMEPGEFNPKKDLKGKAKETEAFESWAENITEQKPYVSMYRDDNGKMVYDVLDKDGKSAFKSSDEELSTNFLRKNYDELMGRMAVTKADKNLNNPAYQKMKAGDDRYADKTEGMGDKIADMAQSMSKDEFMSKADELGLTPEEAAEHYEKMQGGAHAGKFEGNQFAQAVQKAKAAGMKAGDKFKVGDQEYTLKDAIELAGLQLEEFFSEEESDDWTKLMNAVAERYGKEKARVIHDYAQLGTDSGPELMKDHGLTPGDGMEENQREWFKKFPWLEKLDKTSWMDRLINIAGEGPDYGTPVSEDPELARIKNLAFYQ